MARNNIQPGQTLTFTAPYAVASGGGMLTGAMFAVALTDAAQGASVEGRTIDVWDLPKATGAVTAWSKAYWDDTARKVTTSASATTLIGVFTQAAASGDATGRVRLNGVVNA